MLHCICFRPDGKTRSEEVALQQTAERSSSQTVINQPESNQVVIPSELNALGSARRKSTTSLDSASQALCFHILAESPSIISVFSDTTDGKSIYQNIKSLEYYGDLAKVNRSSYIRILNSLFSFEQSDEISVASVLAELDANGSWAGSIMVSPKLHLDPPPKDSPVVTGDSNLNPSVAGLISHVRPHPRSTSHDGQGHLLAPQMSENLHRIIGCIEGADPVSAPQAIDKHLPSFRKAPTRVKGLLMPSFQSMLSKSTCSTGSTRSIEQGGQSNHHSLSREQTGGCSKAISSQGTVSRSLTDVKEASSSALLTSTKHDSAAKAALEEEIPQILQDNALVKPPRVPSQGCQSAHGNLSVWEEVEHEGMISAFVSVNKSNPNVPFQWHDLSIKKLTHPVTGEPLILVTQNDVTMRVAMERAMLACASTQLNMVSSIFPLHVVEFFNQQREPKRSGSHFRRDNQHDIGQLARSHKDVTILFMVG
jgi:hypothetical protein